MSSILTGLIPLIVAQKLIDKKSKYVDVLGNIFLDGKQNIRATDISQAIDHAMHQMPEDKRMIVLHESYKIAQNLEEKDNFFIYPLFMDLAESQGIDPGLITLCYLIRGEMDKDTLEPKTAPNSWDITFNKNEYTFRQMKFLEVYKGYFNVAVDGDVFCILNHIGVSIDRIPETAAIMIDNKQLKELVSHPVFEKHDIVLQYDGQRRGRTSYNYRNRLPCMPVKDYLFQKIKEKQPGFDTP